MKHAIVLSLVLLPGFVGDRFTNEIQAAQLTRGPYLQAAASNSITLRWRTDVPAASIVVYGTDSTNISYIYSSAQTTEHSFKLSRLKPSTSYFYSVGTSTETLAQGPDCKFITAPGNCNTRPTRIWVTGDNGGFSSGATNVIGMRDAYRSFTGSRGTDLWLLMGDIAYNEGTDQEFQTDFFDVFASDLHQVAPRPAIGNHDTYAQATNGWFAYLDIFNFLTNGEAGGVPSGTENFYSFDYGNIHLVCLDSMSQSRAPDGPMANWLRADLETTTNQWKIAYWHHPPYTKGTHDSDDEIELIEMRQNILPILESHGVDLVLCGHSHNYERSYLLRGHYGLSTTLQPSMLLDNGSGREQDTGAYIKPVSGPLANQGTVYVVVGDSASWDERYGHHPAMFTDDLSVGSVVLDVNSNRLDAVFLRSTGDIFDNFTIIKSEPEPLRVCTFALQSSASVLRWKSLRDATYQVEQTDDLQAPNWQPIGAPVVATGATTSWTNAIDPSAAANFFRVVQIAQ
jgi:hypothetical protein